MPGVIIVTCLSAGTDLATKKLKGAFSKSIITTGEISPTVKTGALLLVGSTKAVVDMLLSSLEWIYVCSLSKIQMIGEKRMEEMWGVMNEQFPDIVKYDGWA